MLFCWARRDGCGVRERARASRREDVFMVFKLSVWVELSKALISGLRRRWGS